MEDSCRISRDPLGRDDDTFDEATGLYAAVNANVEVYVGCCMIYEEQRPATGETGAVYEQVRHYWVEVPVTVTDLKENDDVHCLSSNDPALVGQHFCVSEFQDDTFATARRIRMYQRKDRPRV